jgi:AcrR family transcriptional regulator
VPNGPDTRTQLLDAAERLLLAEGYAAVTSRRVVEEAGVSSKLVHYYFGTMDDLYVEVFRRRAEEGLERFENALAENRSLRTLWEVSLDPTGFNLEFGALANHRPKVRAELASVATRFRALQVEAMTQLLAERGLPREDYPPDLLVMAMTGLSVILTQEDRLGLDEGHQEAIATLERLITDFDQTRTPK